MLGKTPDALEDPADPATGQLAETLVFAELRRQLTYNGGSSRRAARSHGAARCVVPRVTCRTRARELPGHVPVDPQQHRTNDGALVPSVRHDLSTDRLGRPSEPLAHHRRFVVPGPAAEEAYAADAHADLRVAAKPDEALFGGCSPTLWMSMIAPLRVGMYGCWEGPADGVGGAW